MAEVKVKEKEDKYSHLRKVYNTKQEEIKIVDTKDSVAIKQTTVMISRKQLLVDVGILLAILAISLSGYLLSKVL